LNDRDTFKRNSHLQISVGRDTIIDKLRNDLGKIEKQIIVLRFSQDGFSVIE